ncbi:MAG TPA: MFS transporter [Tepidisphaeraceae bacterium]|nr:MFS transporter [Tepidisphaeraceae bacterium]
MAVEATAELAAEVETEGMRAQRRRGLFFVGLAAGAVGFAMTSQLALNANFVGTEMGLSGLQQGILETFRESCGIMALGLMALLTGLAEPLIGAGMLVLLGVGLSAYAFVGDYFWLIVSSLVWSQGLHTWMPLPNSMALALAEPGRAGRRLGQVTAAGAVGSATGLVVALVLHVWGGVTIRPLWLVAGAAALVGSVACLGIPRRTRTRGPRLVIRREYALYYLLSFLEGWRKQIFVAFAGFLLVKQQGTPLKTMLILWITAQGIGWIISPIVGRIIDRVGERPVLTAYYASLSLLFIGYAQIQNAYVLYGLFVADSVFFMCTMALTTYVNRIAPKSEHTATLSMGVAVNHVAAVTMPLVGGGCCGIGWGISGHSGSVRRWRRRASWRRCDCRAELA